jgi:hypothetical protein
LPGLFYCRSPGAFSSEAGTGSREENAIKQSARAVQRFLETMDRFGRAAQPGTTMTETPSKSRQTADIAFGKAKSQFDARERVFAELDSMVGARDEKTLRLREARLAKELQDQLAASASPVAKKNKKS